MAFAKGKFGIEYNPNPIDEESSGAGWLVAVIVLAAIAVLAAAGVRRLLSSSPDEPSPIDTPVGVQTVTPVATNAPPHVEPPPPPPPPLPPGAERNRPRVAQNLLLKLEKAEAAKDVELAVATIEHLRALPGEAVADLDNSLARRLGELNIRRLFVGKNRQWVKEVVVRRGDSATRIASENGSTLASLLKLNELPSADRLRIGQKLDVMDHPRFKYVQTSVVTVKPAGTGKPTKFISAKFAPLPPSRFFISA